MHMEEQKNMSDGSQTDHRQWIDWTLDVLSDGRPRSGREVYDMLCPDSNDLKTEMQILGALNDLCINGQVKRDISEAVVMRCEGDDKVPFAITPICATYCLHKTPPHPLQTQMDLACCKRDAEAFAEKDGYAGHEDVVEELLKAAELIGKAMGHLNVASYLEYQHDCEKALKADEGEEE